MSGLVLEDHESRLGELEGWTKNFTEDMATKLTELENIISKMGVKVDFTSQESGQSLKEIAKLKGLEKIRGVLVAMFEEFYYGDTPLEQIKKLSKEWLDTISLSPVKESPHEKETEKKECEHKNRMGWADSNGTFGESCTDCGKELASGGEKDTALDLEGCTKPPEPKPFSTKEARDFYESSKPYITIEPREDDVLEKVEGVMKFLNLRLDKQKQEFVEKFNEMWHKISTVMSNWSVGSKYNFKAEQHVEINDILDAFKRDLEEKLQ